MRNLHVKNYRPMVVAAVAAGVLVLAGCGSSGDDSASPAEQAPATQEQGNDAASGQGAVETPEGFDIPEGTPLAEGLIPELSHIPLPDEPAVFTPGSAHDAEVDPRETAIQGVHFLIPTQELADFYFTALPDAGFTVTSEKPVVAESGGAVVEFTDPDGLPGRIHLGLSNMGESSININLFRSGTS